VCFYECLQNPKTPSFGQSPSHHQHKQENQTQQEFKIQTLQMLNRLFLSVMFCDPKDYVIYLLLLQQTLTKWYKEILKDFKRFFLKIFFENIPRIFPEK